MVVGWGVASVAGAGSPLDVHAVASASRRPHSNNALAHGVPQAAARTPPVKGCSARNRFVCSISLEPFIFFVIHACDDAFLSAARCLESSTPTSTDPARSAQLRYLTTWVSSTECR